MNEKMIVKVLEAAGQRISDLEFEIECKKLEIERKTSEIEKLNKRTQPHEEEQK